MPPKADISAYLPLKAPDFSILLVLARAPSYGYGIVKAVAEESGGAVRMAPGNLYQVLDRMMEAGVVREAAQDEIPVCDVDERRRYYTITDLGRRVARAEAERLAAVMGTARAMGLLAGAAGGGEGVGRGRGGG